MVSVSVSAGLARAHFATRQRRILAAVREEPGILKSHLCATLGIAWATLCRDVDDLVDSGAVVVHRPGRDCHLYVPEDAPRHPSLALDHAHHILRMLAEGPATALEVAKALRINQPTVQHHLHALGADGLVAGEGYVPRLYRLLDPDQF